MSKRKFELGDNVVVNNKISSWNKTRNGVNVGSKGVVESYGYNGTYTVRLQDSKAVISDYSNAFDKAEAISTIEEFNLLIEKAESKIKATEAFIQETRNKIDFLKETGTDVFNENEFKAYQTLGIIEQSGMSKIEKAKVIAALISGK